jgi:hypothetical protein
MLPPQDEPESSDQKPSEPLTRPAGKLLILKAQKVQILKWFQNLHPQIVKYREILKKLSISLWDMCPSEGFSAPLGRRASVSRKNIFLKSGG